MKLLERFWTVVASAINFVTFTSYFEDGSQQVQLSILHGDVVADPNGSPRFKPPSSQPFDGFFCEYPKMKGWRFCSTPENRSCWLTNDKGGIYDINTDYEKHSPEGIVRKYYLNVTDGTINADGLPFTGAVMFNNTYPGPWLQACWGDTVEITIENSLNYNGTSIHWHGVRQWLTMQMDGVNGITQCPIAPSQSFVYRWKVTQYGSSWYHSHYSLQYADGLVGPLTLHGPTSAPFDEAVEWPLLITDWGHNTAFEAIYTNDLGNPSILLNGTGNVTRYSGVKNTEPIPLQYSVTFINETGPRKRPKKYLIRLINTSFETTFVFSIDNHWLQVVSTDFVPIIPYNTTSVLVGIGQRYNIIVEAKPVANGTRQPLDGHGNYWIRTYIAHCVDPLGHRIKGYELSGIIRYDNTSSADPTSKAWDDITLDCSDEDYVNLIPVVPWQIGPAANGHGGQEFDITGLPDGEQPPYPVAFFSLQGQTPPSNTAYVPFRINYSDPTFLHLNNTGSWPTPWVVVPENYTSKDWIYLIIAGDKDEQNTTFGAHPIHLHGHDFAILQTEKNMSYNIGNLNLTTNNPPRRDVVLLPSNGFMVIAFKADNPGTWLMHCHIARHASAGLALQILERQGDANHIWPYKTSPAIAKAEDLCNSWHSWQRDCNNWWPGKNVSGGGCKLVQEDPEFAFQDDSGI